MLVQSVGKKYLLVLEICIRTDKNLKNDVNLSKQNNDKSSILNLIKMKLHRIHERIVVRDCAKYRKQIFIGVGDMHPDFSNIMSIWANKNGDKSAILNLILTTLHRIHWMDGQTHRRMEGRTVPKSLSPTTKFVLVGDNKWWTKQFNIWQNLGVGGLSTSVMLSHLWHDGQSQH